MKLLHALSLMAALVHTISGTPLAASSRNTQAKAIINAVHAWRNDTGVVSALINGIDNQSFPSQMSFHHAAKRANSSELNELIHKAYLDSVLPPSDALANANNTLVAEGTFEQVVELLMNLTQLQYNQPQVQADANEINFGTQQTPGRCQAVLPAIDVYFSQASDYLKNLNGDTQLENVTAIAPSACNDN